MVSIKLRIKAEEFIDTLKYILRKSLGIDTEFTEKSLKNNSILKVENKKPGFPLVRKSDDPNNPILFLYLLYAMELDSSGKHLRIESSSISLQADVTGSKKACPLVRVEYKRQRMRSPAHMHIHANSPEIAWLYGTAGCPTPNLHALHFPVGGRRFRPTLEEFLFFLNDERLFTDWQEGWRQHLDKTLTNWECIQARTTIRTYEKDAADVLRELGYKVIPPQP